MQTKDDLKDRAEAMIDQLRNLSVGRQRWYVRHKTDGGVCIWFESYERHEAQEWWTDHPGHHKDWELVLLHHQDQAEQVMAEAANLIAELAG